GPHVRLAVTDNGSGMDPRTIEHIFEPFFTTKPTGEGTGLGLAVVHGIVKLHRGAISVRSAPNAGTTFEMIFPATEEEAPLPAPAASNKVPHGTGQRIMVVDDDGVSGFSLEKLIETLRYSVKRYTRPADALAAFAADPHSWDLVVSDLAMPKMNGDELARRLLRIRPDLPVIIVTGYIETVRQQWLEATAVRAVLHKPVARPELARALAEHLGPPAE
ncbi:MAG: response regulator, partial [Verrucomicrobia bacterium]|nr:response regulator [Verrucomicrobiota bacterium]